MDRPLAPITHATHLRITPSPWRTRRLHGLYARLAHAEAALQTQARDTGLLPSIHISTPAGWLAPTSCAALLAHHELPSLVRAELWGHPHGLDLRVDERRRTSIRVHRRRLRLLHPATTALLTALSPPSLALIETCEDLEPSLAELLAGLLTPTSLDRLPGVWPTDRLRPSYALSTDDAIDADERIRAGFAALSTAWTHTPPHAREVARGLASSWDAAACELLDAATELCAAC